MERAIALSDGPELGPSDLPERMRASDQAAPVQVEFVPLEEVERRHILQVFQGVGGNKSLASRILGLNRKTLYRKLREYGVALGDGEG
jgi:two-component system response regulator HydG